MATLDSTKYYLGVAGSERALSANEADMQEPIEMIANEGRTAGGTLFRYKRATKHHFPFRYEELADADRNVFDGGMGYESLRALYEADSVMNFVMPYQGGQRVYVVRFAISSWNARLTRRLGADFYHRLSFELVEV